MGIQLQSGEVRNDGADGIACWVIYAEDNGECFFVRHAYFIGQNEPCKALKTTLKAEINEGAGPPSTATPLVPSKSPRTAASPSKSSTTTAMR